MLAVHRCTPRLGKSGALAGLLAVVVSIAASHHVRGQSQVLAWGDGSYGQCGVPTQIGNQVYSKIGAGDRHTVGLRIDGSIETWGDNSYGQLNVPALPLGVTYVDVVSGPIHSLALRSDGTAVGWGENSNGECNVPALPSGLSFTQIATGRNYSLAVVSDGSMRAWGDDYYGQCDIPPSVNQQVASGLPVVQVAAGYGHSFALFADGSVLGWGYNNIGQANVPALPVGTTYVRISTGAVHSAFLRSDGQITTWGANQYGQCNVPPPPAGLTYVDAVCGDFHTLALRSDGQVIAVGDNSRLQCNLPALPSGFRFVQVDGSQYHSVARVEGPCGPNLCPPGTAFCFGDGLDPNVTTGCPCGNFGSPAHGCANSFNPQGAVMTSSGLIVFDNVVLAASGMPASSLCIYLQGDTLDDAVFGDGIRCAGGYLTRLWPKINVAGASTFPDGTEGSTLSQRGSVTPGSGATRYYQTYYRNASAAFCPPAQFNVTNGVTITW